jgi:hypothetical protein
MPLYFILALGIEPWSLSKLRIYSNIDLYPQFRGAIKKIKPGGISIKVSRRKYENMIGT